eukprot:14685639-Alexandrium_andersonii.AAC.1
MSASLVGSEMCIRDRIVACLRNIVGGEGHERGFQLAAQEAGASASFQAVSYTHLTLPTICSV